MEIRKTKPCDYEKDVRTYMKTFVKTVIIAIIALALIVVSFSWRRQDAAIAKKNADSTVEASSDAMSDAWSIAETGTDSLAASVAESTADTSTAFTRVYRLYNPNTGEHFLTTAKNEADHDQQAGWKYEGVAFYAPAEKTDTPVYRLSNPNNGDHFYTANQGEVNYLTQAGWKNEGVAWYSGGTEAVYRVTNTGSSAYNHSYATSENEKNYLVSQGWKDEGICWFALDPSKLVAEDGTPVLVHDKV